MGAREILVSATVVEPGVIRMDMADPSGNPVATIGRLRTRPLGGELSASATVQGLHRVDWSAVPVPNRSEKQIRVAVLDQRGVWPQWADALDLTGAAVDLYRDVASINAASPALSM